MPSRQTQRKIVSSRSAPRQVVLRVTIAEIEPAIWRMIRLPEAYTLHQLHRVLQLVFGWLDYHLYEFRGFGHQFEGPHPEAEGETTEDVSLADLKLKRGARFEYTYDFGDGWEHELEVIDFLPMPDGQTLDWTPRLIDGARAGPPEDAGGAPGYSHIIGALNDPKNEEHAMYRAWVGPDYDPERFDLRSVDRALALASGWGAV